MKIDDLKIGIIGSGTAGRILGSAFAERGHRVCLGTRDPPKLAEWKAQDRLARLGRQRRGCRAFR